MAYKHYGKLHQLFNVQFTVFGDVQNHFYEKFLLANAKSNRVRGWCQPRKDGTIVGGLEGTKAQLDKMFEWMEKVGSPDSKVERVKFEKEQAVPYYTIYRNFYIYRKQ